MTYFARFGYRGLIGLLIACFLIAFCGAKALLAVYRLNIQDPHTFNVAAGGKMIGGFLTVCCGAFGYSAYIIMLAGIRQLCGGSFIAVLAVSVAAYIVLYKGFGTLVKICGIFAPVIACLIALTALIGSFRGDRGGAPVNTVYESGYAGILFRALLYAGYNVLTSVCVLGRSAHLIKKNSHAVWGGIIGGAMLFISGSAVILALIHANIAPGAYEMPILAFFEGRNALIFNAVLFSAMLLSVISGLTGTCVFFSNILPERKLGLILGILAIPAAYVSFGRLMDILYPVFGFAGIFLIIVLALMGRKNV